MICCLGICSDRNMANPDLVGKVKPVRDHDDIFTSTQNNFFPMTIEEYTIYFDPATQ